jgi:hypothetical protein
LFCGCAPLRGLAVGSLFATAVPEIFNLSVICFYCFFLKMIDAGAIYYGAGRHMYG